MKTQAQINAEMVAANAALEKARAAQSRDASPTNKRKYAAARAEFDFAFAQKYRGEQAARDMFGR